MKKVFLAFSFMLVALLVLGCNTVTTTATTTTTTTSTTTTTTTTTSTVTPTDTDPVISGADNVTIEKNAGFVPLAGVSAFDQEDGDLTSALHYTGNVNPNAVGVYTATYTVTDSDGNITTVTRTVTVVFTDSQVPLFSGVADKTIYVGEEINLLSGISATDTVDGVVQVSVEGTVDIWTPGEYDLVYTAEDSSGNEATANRTITVSFGDFVFGAEEDIPFANFTLNGTEYVSPAITGGIINTAIAAFSYVRVTLTLTADTAGTVAVTLENLPSNMTEIAATTTETEYVLYYVITTPLADAALTIDASSLTLSNVTVSLSYAEVRDMVAPELHVPSAEAAYVVGYAMPELDAILRSGVTSVDDVDGNISSAVTIDYGTLDLNTVGVYDVVYSSIDAGGNESTFTRSVVVGNLVDGGFITDPNFENDGDGQWKEKSSNGQASIAYNSVDGTMIVTVTSVGGWLSAAGAYLKEPSTTLLPDQWYMFTFTVSTTINRTMGFRMGLATDEAHGWVDDFDGINSHTYAITATPQTFNFFFKLDSITSTAGYNEFLIELNLGSFNYSTVGTNGVTTFSNVAMSKVVTSFEAPTYETHSAADLPVKFTVGDTAPDWSQYVTFKDMSNTVLTPVIDSSAVNFSAAGTYDVLFTATDSHDMITTYTLSVEVLSVENADTTGPVITVDSLVVTTIDQFTSITVPLISLVTAVDAVDGEIVITEAMLDDGGLDFDVAGVYTVTFSVYDLSGNVTVLSTDVTVVDKQAPTISIGDFTINLGDAFDPLFGLTVTDNVDGAISNSNVTVTGLEFFITAGIATEEGTFEITYSVADALGNTATKVVEVMISNLVWDEATRTPLTITTGTLVKSTVTYDAGNSEYVITGIDTSGESWEHPRWTYIYNSGTGLELGKTYKFEIVAKATTATDLHFRIGATLSADPWIDNYTGGLKTVSITDAYVTYQVIFTVDKPFVDGTAKFEFTYGYLSTDATNTIYIKSFDLVQEAEPVFENVLNFQTPDEIANASSYLDFADEAYVINNIVVATYDWDPSRIVYYLDQSKFEMGKTYRIAFTAKALTATEVRLRLGATLWVDPWIADFTGGLKTINLTTGYADYEMTFTVDQAMVNGNAKFQFMTGYLSTDAGNAVFIKNFVLEEVIEPHLLDAVLIDDFQYADDTAMEAEWTERSGGVNYTPSDRTAIDAVNHALIFSNLEGKANGWNLIRKYDSLASFGGTDTYKYLSFYITNNTNVTSGSIWLYWSGSQNAYAVTLPAIGESGWVTLDVTTSGHQVTEITDFAFGFDTWGTVSGSYTVQFVYLVKDVAELAFVEVPAEVVTPEPVSIIVDDFNYADETAFEVAWTERSGGANINPSALMNLDDIKNGLVFTLPVAAQDGWNLARKYATLSSFGATDADKFLAFYVTNNTNVTSCGVWLYWSGNQNVYTVTLPAIGTTGWAYINVTTSGHTVSEIVDFAIGFNNWTSSQVTGSLSIYSVQLVKDPVALFNIDVEIGYLSVVTFNDFEGYADNAAYQADTTDNIEGTRIGGGTFIKSNGTLTIDGDNNLLVQNVSATTGTNGIKIRITKASIDEHLNYIAIWIKATDTTNMVKFQSFTYTAAGTYQEITSTLVSDFAQLGSGTIVYIPVSSLRSDTIIVSLVVNCGAGAVGQLQFDDILLVENFIVHENAAPTVAVSDANLQAISGLTLVAGQDISTLEAMLLSVLEVSDAEDGTITPVVGMINYNGLDLTNPVMGTYSIDIIATDSEGLVSTTLTLHVSVVTIMQDFESFTDDADFKANYTDLLGLRSAGGAWGTTAGTLVDDAGNNVIQFTYGPGTNGIKIAVTKTALEALGAEYVGIFVKTSAEVVGVTSMIQAFYYNPAGFTQISTTYGNISYADGGTYIYIKVSDLAADTTGISLMLNLATGNAGTMFMDNLVIK